MKITKKEAREDLDHVMELRRSHNGETTTDTKSFGCLGYRILGRHTDCVSLDELVTAARRRLKRATT